MARKKKEKPEIDDDPAFEAVDILVKILEGCGALRTNTAGPDQSNYWDSLALSLDIITQKLDNFEESKRLKMNEEDVDRVKMMLEIEEVAQEIRTMALSLSDETKETLSEMIQLCQELESTLKRLLPLARSLNGAICRQNAMTNSVLQSIFQSLSNLYTSNMDEAKADLRYASARLRRRCIDSKSSPWNDAILFLGEISNDIQIGNSQEVDSEGKYDLALDTITDGISSVNLSDPDPPFIRTSLIELIKAFSFGKIQEKNFMSILLVGPVGSGKTFQFREIEKIVESRAEIIRPSLPYDLMGQTVGSSEDLLLSIISYARQTCSKPSIIVLDDIETIIGQGYESSAKSVADESSDHKSAREPHVTARIRAVLLSLLDSIQHTEKEGNRTMLICSSKLNFGKSMDRFDFIFTLSAPSEEERKAIIMRKLRIEDSKSILTFEPVLSNLVECTSGLSYAELAQYCRQGMLMSHDQYDSTTVSNEDFNVRFLEALKEQLQMSMPESLRNGVNTEFVDMKVMSAKDLRAQSTIKEPSTADLPLFGKSMESAWQELLRSIVMPICKAGALDKLLYQHGGKGGKTFAGGVILTGPPGCGKSALAYHCALIAATINSSVKLVDVSCTSLISKEVGSSERSIHRLFRAARAAAPCILLMDGIENVAAVRGNDNTTEGTMDRVLSTLLTELDGIDSEEYSLADPACLSIIGITHNSEWIDPALRRPGRLGSVIEIGRPEYEARRSIALQELRESNYMHEDDILDGKYSGFDDAIDLIAQETEGFTAAGVIALCSDAKMYSSKAWFENTNDHDMQLKLSHILAAIKEKHER